MAAPDAMDGGGLVAEEVRLALVLPADEPVATRQADLTVDVVRDMDGIRALTRDYEHLYRATANTLPFALQEWHLAWCAHFLNRNPQIEEKPLFHVLRDRGGECIAIVPMVFTRRRVGLVRVATVHLVGADPGITEIHSPLVVPGCERAAVRAVHASLAAIGDWDWIQWTSVSDAMAEALSGVGAPQWYETGKDYVLDLPSSWEQFRAGLKRNIRQSLRHCYNSLRRDGHAFEFVVARERLEVRQALQRFLELHAMRANMIWGPKHPNRFAMRAAQEFLYDVCERLAARDAVRVFQLRIGRETVASRVGFVTGGSLYLYYSGFNPDWARYSVMTTTQAEAIKQAIAEGLTTINLSLVPEQSKLRWRPRLIKFHSAVVHRERLRSRIVCRTYRVARSMNGPAARALKSFFWAHDDWD
jgi:CelD/BcsL family acetyltransferase involved in cellulose biosynthesis